MITALVVAVLGGFGAVARYAIAQWSGRLPWGILAGNTLAAVVAIVALQVAGADSLIATLVVTGFAGGLSTFSSMVAGTHSLLKERAWTRAAINLVANLAVPSTAALLTAVALEALLK